MVTRGAAFRGILGRGTCRTFVLEVRPTTLPELLSGRIPHTGSLYDPCIDLWQASQARGGTAAIHGISGESRPPGRSQVRPIATGEVGISILMMLTWITGHSKTSKQVGQAFRWKSGPTRRLREEVS
jgi:hypothetical protein